MSLIQKMILTIAIGVWSAPVKAEDLKRENFDTYQDYLNWKEVNEEESCVQSIFRDLKEQFALNKKDCMDITIPRPELPKLPPMEIDTDGLLGGGPDIIIGGGNYDVSTYLKELISIENIFNEVGLSLRNDEFSGNFSVEKMVREHCEGQVAEVDAMVLKIQNMKPDKIPKFVKDVEDKFQTIATDCRDNIRAALQKKALTKIKESSYGKTAEQALEDAKQFAKDIEDDAKTALSDLYAWARDAGVPFQGKAPEGPIIEDACDHLHTVTTKQWELNQGQKKTFGAFFNATLEIRSGKKEIYAGSRLSGVVSALGNEGHVIAAEAYVHSRLSDVKESCSENWDPKNDQNDSPDSLTTTALLHFAVVGQTLFNETFEHGLNKPDLLAPDLGEPISIGSIGDFDFDSDWDNALVSEGVRDGVKTTFFVGPIPVATEVGFSGLVSLNSGLSIHGMRGVASLVVD